jgi:hypothetical protein
LAPQIHPIWQAPRYRAFSNLLLALGFGARSTQIPIKVPKWRRIGPATWAIESRARQLGWSFCREKALSMRRLDTPQGCQFLPYLTWFTPLQAQQKPKSDAEDIYNILILI